MQVTQNHWVRQIPWNRKWQPAPGFLPRKFYVQWNLVGYSWRGCKESDTTEHTHTSMKIDIDDYQIIMISLESL